MADEVEAKEEEPTLEVLNTEFGVVEDMSSTFANVNLKALRPQGQVVDAVTKDGEVVDPSLYAVTYNPTHAFLSIRGMTVANPEDEFTMDVTFKEFVPPAPETLPSEPETPPQE